MKTRDILLATSCVLVCGTSTIAAAASANDQEASRHPANGEQRLSVDDTATDGEQKHSNRLAQGIQLVEDFYHQFPRDSLTLETSRDIDADLDQLLSAEHEESEEGLSILINTVREAESAPRLTLDHAIQDRKKELDRINKRYAHKTHHIPVEFQDRSKLQEQSLNDLKIQQAQEIENMEQQIRALEEKTLASRQARS